jgi:RNA-directed DNA polymerase
VDIDLEKFFDTVDHDALMSRVSRRIRDKDLLRLLGKYLRAGVVVDGRLNRTVRGVPQGGPLSPLLSNILLDDLDRELERRKHRFARYADDCIILVKSKRAGERVMAHMSRYLEKVLKVKVNTDKSKVVKVQDCSFLGFMFKGKKLIASVKAVMTFKKRLRRLTGRSWGISMGQVWTYPPLYRGWMNYFGIGMKYTDAVALDHWHEGGSECDHPQAGTRKQWGRARTRIGHLIQLGTPRHQAILTGLSRKGYWHLAKTFATNCGLSKEYLQDQGLVAIRALWVGIHYPATAR